MYNLKQFNSCFTALAMQLSPHEAFTIFLDFCLMVFNPAERQTAMGAFDERANRVNTGQLLLEMFEIMGDLADRAGRGFGDPLGEFFMMEITHGHNGQFFTPEPVCDMMAALQGIPDNGKRIADPACGSGRTLLSMANQNRNVLLYGADIDHVCVKMTVINFLLNSLEGEVAHMDTLRNEFYCGYKTGVVLGLDGMYYPCYTKFTDANQSYIWLRPPAMGDNPTPTEFKQTPTTTGQQGTLF